MKPLQELTHTVEASRDPRRSEPATPVDPAMLLVPLDERRFAVGEERARGGIGRIIEARDELLGRRVAFKQLLHAEGATSQLRFMREAMITARLQHPSIVPVYDAGVRQSGDPYYTMPLVPGRNLHEAVASAPALAERLALLPHVQAVADAVAYAHEQGIVHRDLKPSNVLVGPFGETVVIDWGLAKDVAEGDDAPALPLLADLGFVGDVTRTGVARGTPAYMAPEQARGEAVDARADVYALGAMLYHVLAGRPPHDAARTSLAGPPPPLETVEPRVPRDLAAIAAKAMATAPEARYPSAQAFALDLRRFATGQLVGARRYGWLTLARRFLRRHRVAVASALVVAALTAAIAIPVAHEAGAAPRCTGDEPLMARVWNPERSAAIRRHLESVGGAKAAAQWDLAAPLFDAYAQKWTTMRRDSCVATRVEHTQSDSLFDRRTYCLDRRLAQLDSIATAFGQIDSPKLAGKAAEIASRLPSLEACKESKWLPSWPLPPLGARASIDEAYKVFDRGKALRMQGRDTEALAVFRELEPRADAIGFAPLTADITYEIANAAQGTGDVALAAQAYEKTAVLAAEFERADMVFDCQLNLMRMEAFAEKYDAALVRASALASLARLSPDPAHRLMLHENLGTIYEWMGRADEALAQYREALALMPADSPREAAVRAGYGSVLMSVGDYEAAEPEVRRALELREKKYGAKHPWVARTLTTLGNLAYYRGRFAECLDYFERALAINQAVAGGAETPDIAIDVGNVGTAQEALGRFDEALASYDRALALKQRHFGETHFEVVKTLDNRASVLVKLGRFDEAEATARQALAIRAGAQPKHDADLAAAHGALAEVLLARAAGEHGAAARAAYQAALAALDTTIALAGPSAGQQRAMVAEALLLRARAQLGLGRVVAARADAERGLTILRAQPKPSEDSLLEAGVVLAEAWLAAGQPARAADALGASGEARIDDLRLARAAFVRAQVQWATDRRAEAVATAERALAWLEARPEADAKIRTRAVRAWLDTHRP